MSVTYHANSLEEIAKMFDDMANNASKKMAGASTVKENCRHSGEMYAWTAAASVLRQTKMVQS